MLEKQNYQTCSANGRWIGQLPTCESKTFFYLSFASNKCFKNVTVTSVH